MLGEKAHGEKIRRMNTFDDKFYLYGNESVKIQLLDFPKGSCTFGPQIERCHTSLLGDEHRQGEGLRGSVRQRRDY